MSYICLTSFLGKDDIVNGVTLTKNTGYDVIGHCFFCSEDGVEENHTISYNFASHIHILGPFWQPSFGVSFGMKKNKRKMRKIVINY